MSHIQRYFLILALVFSSKISAQEPTSSAAKSQYKMYKTAIEKLASINPTDKSAAYKNQITQAENALKNIKKYEPSFNASAMEEEIQKHKALVGDAPKDEKKEDFAKLRVALDNMKQGEESSISSGSTSNWGQVQFYLDLYKKKYSDEDLAPYRKELDDYKADYASKMSGKKEEKNIVKDFEKNFKKVFINDHYDLTTDKEENISLIEENLKTYQKNLEAFLTPSNIAIGSNQNESTVNYWYKYAVNQGEGTKATINKIIENCKSTYFSRKVKAVSNYCELQSYQIKFNCYRKLFSEKPELVAIANEINNLVKSAGSKDELISLAKKNDVELTKNRRMKPAVRTDIAIENEIKEALKSKNLTIVKINLLDNEWSVIRNELTGIPRGRFQTFHMVTKNDNGTCTLYDLFLRQDFDGTKYLSGYVTGYGTGWDILCENVK